MRPRHRMAPTVVPWQFPADLSIIYWLETMGYDYDVITDEDLHQEGLACLEPYNVVINATHAEYYSERMMDATEDYLASGGRLMYLSGNGYYWVVSFRDGDMDVMEVRRLDMGTRAWNAEPGEHYMVSNGERGGLWRGRGRAPQKLLGTGFTSEGMDESKPYRKMPDADDPAASWIFDGVDGDIIGDEGLGIGGAAGIEFDRYDLALGTPPAHADPCVLRGAFGQLPPRGGGHPLQLPRHGGHAGPPRARGHDLLHDAGGRRGVVGELHRLGPGAPHQRLRQQRVEGHRQRAERVHEGRPAAGGLIRRDRTPTQQTGSEPSGKNENEPSSATI